MDLVLPRGGWTIRKVIEGGGRGTKKNNEKRKKKSVVQRRNKETKFCRVNCTVLLANFTLLNGNMATTLYRSFNFRVLVGSSFTCVATSLWTLVAKQPCRKNPMEPRLKSDKKKRKLCAIRNHPV